MIGWYLCYMLALFVLLLISSQRDRRALRVLFGAAILSELLKYGMPDYSPRSWETVARELVSFNAPVEALTFLMLLKWAKNRTGHMQEVCVAGALVAHLIAFLAIKMELFIIYPRYLTVIKLIALVQLVAFHDTVGYNLRRLSLLMESVRHSRVDALRAGVVHPDLLHDPHPPRLQTLSESRQTD